MLFCMVKPGFLNGNLPDQTINITFNAEISLNGLEMTGKKLIHCIVRDVTERRYEKKLSKTLAVSSLIGIYVLSDGKFHILRRQKGSSR